MRSRFVALVFALLFTMAWACTPLLDIDGFEYRPASGGASAQGGDGGRGGGGGAGGVEETGGGGEGGSAAGGAPPSVAYHQVTVTAGAAVSEGYSISVVFDHAEAVAAGASADGSDLRVYFEDGGQLTEIDRMVDPTSGLDRADSLIWLPAQQAIDAGSSDTRYYIGYGGGAAPPPMADGSAIFLLWDDFDGGSNGTFDIVGTASGTAEENGGLLRLTGDTGDIYQMADDFIFFHWSIGGDFVADTFTTDTGGGAGEWARLGGVMVRQALTRESRNQRVGAIAVNNTRNSTWRLADGADSDFAGDGSGEMLPEYYRLKRVGDDISTAYSTDGATWVDITTDNTFTEALVDPVFVGIPLSTFNEADGWVETEWFRLRRIVEPEPTTSVGPALTRAP